MRFTEPINYFSLKKKKKINHSRAMLTCLWRNLYAGQEATVRTGHETTDWFQTGKGVRQGCILSPCLYTHEYIYMQSTS